MKGIFGLSLGAGVLTVMGFVMIGQVFVGNTQSPGLFDYPLVPGIAGAKALGYNRPHDVEFWALCLFLDCIFYSLLYLVVFWLRHQFKAKRDNATGNVKAKLL